MATGHEVCVLAREGDATRPDYDLREDVEDGLQVSRVNYNFGDARSFEDIWQNDRMDSILAERLVGFVPDLVHVHHLTCLSTGFLDVVKDRDLPLVMTLHDFWMVCPRGQRIDPELELCEVIDRAKCGRCLSKLWPHFFPEGGDLDALRRWDEEIVRRLNRCDRLLTPSDFHRDRMLEFPLDPERVAALPHGLDHRLLARRRDPQAPIKRIGFIGTVIPSKGVHTLVEAFARLDRPGLELHVHGDAPCFHGDTGYPDRLRLAAAGCAEVHFHGGYDQRELPLILDGLDVLVVPSVWWESFCLTIREGLLSGLIVVAADHGAMREALGGGADGLLFEPGSAKSLQRALTRLVDEDGLAARLRNRGGGVATIERNANDMLDVYAGVLRETGRDPGLAWPEVAVPAVVEEAPKSPAELGVTVFIPTWNGGALFETVLERVFAQKTDFDYEVLVIDSGSKDETLSILRKFPVRLIEIPNHEFNHGLTRNRAVREAKGGIVALLTQDAVPYDEHWLANLVSNFEDSQVAGAYCHQLPRENCNPFQRDRLEGWTQGEGEREVRRIESRASYESLTPMEKYRTIAFDDVASCVRKSVMESIPFERRQFGEDVAWAKQAILAGYKIVMDPRAVVVHSHDNPIFYEFKRVYLDHQNLNDLVGMHLVRSFGEALRFTVDGTRHLGGVIRRSKISWPAKLKWWMKVPFYSLGQNMGQFLGARSSIEKKRGIYGWLDRRLKKGV
ncbi:MAG: glycosyltransferase [Planctomycetes bacterium]|nr:glycosyltransferase [Planctomycetota bacterium]